MRDPYTTPRLVSDLIPFWAARTPNAPALADSVRDWSYAELDRAVRVAAQVLEKIGVRAGDRMLLVCENCSAAVAVYFACNMLRAWPAIVNARLSDREIEEIRLHCGARVMVFTTEGSLHALRHAQKYGAGEVGFPGLNSVMLGPVDHHALSESTEPEPDDDVAALVYTSGTTGRAKGVMLSHKNLLFVARGSSNVRRLSPADRVLALLPVSHILGLTGVLLGSFVSGAQVRLMTRFDPGLLLEKIERGGVSVLIGTPSMYTMLAEYAGRKKIARVSASALRIISSAGAPLDLVTRTRTEALFGQALHNGYGITECSPTITLTDIDSLPSDCSVGRPLAGIQARLVDPSGADVAGDEAGELWVRGPGVMKGYYRAPAETALVLDADGWFRTGDLVRVVDGNFYVVGRSKEMIIRFGFNVYPAEIEAVLNAHPLVSRAAVLAREGVGGEDITAFVESRPGEKVTESELAEYSCAMLAPYKRPSAYILIDALPLSPAGKVLKNELAIRLTVREEERVCMSA